MSEIVKKKENRRVRYTRLALRESLLSQLEHMPLNKISVSRVCEMADVNRSTFYLYYKDVYDLMEKIEDELYEELNSQVTKSQGFIPSADYLRRIFEIIYKNRDLARVVFGKHGNKEFLKKVSTVYRDRTVTDWKKMSDRVDEAALDYLYTFSTYTSIGVIERWIEKDFQETPEVLAQITSRLLSYGITQYINIK